jgi:hypothetical protein
MRSQCDGINWLEPMTRWMSSAYRCRCRPPCRGGLVSWISPADFVSQRPHRRTARHTSCDPVQSLVSDEYQAQANKGVAYAHRPSEECRFRRRLPCQRKLRNITRAAEHATHVARHHTEAAKHHEAGRHEKAAHHAHTAMGHAFHARGHAEEAAKAHADEHGNK